MISTDDTPKAYTTEQIDNLLVELNTLNEGWSLQQGKLSKTFTFKNFATAFDFISACAIYAEKINHHPEWSNVYNKVSVQLITHDIDNISGRDADLAKQMEFYHQKNNSSTKSNTKS